MDVVIFKQSLLNVAERHSLLFVHRKTVNQTALEQ